MDISALLEKACFFIINDWRWNRHHDHTQILMPLVKFYNTEKVIFISNHIFIDYRQAQQEFDNFTENSVFESFNKIISVYKAHGLVTFIGKNSQPLNIKACNINLQHVLPSIKEYLFSQKDISSYDGAHGMLHDNDREIPFGLDCLPNRILSLLYSSGDPISMESILRGWN